MSKHTTLEQMKLLAQRTKGEISKVESKSLVALRSTALPWPSPTRWWTF